MIDDQSGGVEAGNEWKMLTMRVHDSSRHLRRRRSSQETKQLMSLSMEVMGPI